VATRIRAGYVDRLLRGFAPTPGRHHAMIEHQAGCAFGRTGRCTCCPEIAITGPDGGITEIDAAGVPRRAVRQ
jgi:hypothetical protein